MVSSTDKLIIAISSRALFDLDESHHVFEHSGIRAYRDYQIAHEDVVLEPGAAFQFTRKLLAISDDQEQPMVEVILLSRNTADTGLRIFNSIQHHRLNINRAVFTGGCSPYCYINAFGAQLYLSANAEDVRKALHAGIAAATLLPTPKIINSSSQCRIAFDGDAVIFSDEAEKIYQNSNLKAFVHNEQQHRHIPLSGGPFKAFLSALHRIQMTFNEEDSPIRTALVTARSAPAHERVIRTLRAWNIRIDEALFLGGLSKAQFLKAFNADVFFDDQWQHCHSAGQYVATGHVPHGVVNLTTQEQSSNP